MACFELDSKNPSHLRWFPRNFELPKSQSLIILNGVKNLCCSYMIHIYPISNISETASICKWNTSFFSYLCIIFLSLYLFFIFVLFFFLLFYILLSSLYYFIFSSLYHFIFFIFIFFYFLHKEQ